MNEHFVRGQGRPRGAAGRRLRLHGRRRLADRPRRLADDGVPHARRASRSSAARTSRPSRVTACRASGSCCRRSPMRSASGARTSSAHAGAITDAVRARPARAVARAADRPRSCRTRCAGCGSSFDPVWGGFGSAPKFPPASTLEFLLRARRARAGDEDAGRDGARRDVRPRRRRLPPLLGRRARGSCRTSRRCCTTTRCSSRVPARLARDREASATARSSRRRSTYMLRELRAARRRLRLGAGRRHGRRRGTDVHVDAGRRRPRELLQPFEHGRFIIRGELDSETRGRGSSRSASCGRSRCATTRRSLPGTALRSPRSRSRAADSNEHDWLEAARASRGVPARPALDPGRPALPQLARGRGEARGRARGLRRRGQRPLRAARRNRRAALARRVAPARDPRRRVVRRRRARRLLPDARATASSSSARKKDFDDHPTPSGNSMLAYVLLRLARICGGDQSWSAGRSASSASSLRLLPQAPSAFGHALNALDLHFSPAPRAGGDRRAGHRASRAPRSPLRPECGRRVRPERGRPAAAGKDLVDGRPAVYICQNFACRGAPITQPADLVSATGGA